MPQQIQDVLKLIASGNHQEATTRLLELTQQQPDNTEILTLLGHSHMAEGQHQAALTVFEKVVELTPDSAANAAKVAADLAGVHHTMGQLDNAEQYFRQSLALDPTANQSWHFLGLVLHAKGQVKEGNECLEKAEQNDPFNALLAQAQSAGEKGQQDQTWKICGQILGQQKNHPRALYMMAMISAQRGAFEHAIKYLNKALSYSPYNQSLWNLLSQIYVQMRQYPLAIEASQKLIELQPDSYRYWLLHADNLVNGAQYQQALTALDNALKYTDDPLHVRLQQGHVNRTLGNTAASIEAYKGCLQSKQTMGAAYWALANFSDHQFTDDDVQAMKDIQLDTEMSPVQACQGAFALAKVLEEQQQYKQAFIAYKSANLNRPGNHFVPEKHQRICQSLIETFSAKLFAQTGAVKTAQTSVVTPIFIVGLPRSGSTLIEQILASHSQIEGTEELKVLPTLAKRLFMHSREKNRNDSGQMDKFTPAELQQYGDAYLEQSKIYRSDKAYFIDKLPPNFQHVGLIQLILPHAIIIDARRQPLSCGFGIYKQYFGHGHDFSYNLQHIAFYYNQYLKVMDHWDNALPGKVLCVQYEQMVLDTETQVKALLEHCGLPFEQQCLEFHQNKRAVKTASADQVRQPINRKGMDLWLNFEVQLQPLKEALGEQTLARFT